MKKISIQKNSFVEIKPTAGTGVFLFDNVYTHTRLSGFTNNI